MRHAPSLSMVSAAPIGAHHQRTEHPNEGAPFPTPKKFPRTVFSDALSNPEEIQRIPVARCRSWLVHLRPDPARRYEGRRLLRTGGFAANCGGARWPSHLDPDPGLSHREAKRADHRIRRLLASSALAALLSIADGGAAVASESADASKKAETAIPFSWDMAVTSTNYYVERGVFVNRKGGVFQSYGNLYFVLYDGGSFINSVTVGAGYWLDFNTYGKPASNDASGFDPYFTEADAIPSLAIKMFDRLTLTARYNHWMSPSQAYGQGSWANGTLSFNDSGLTFPNFSIQPYLTVLYELPGKSYPGLIPHAWYFEPGIQPNYTFFSDTKCPVNFAVPVTLGLGKKFYDGQPYGYLTVGPQISIPLNFVPAAYGKWSASLSYKYWNLGRQTAAISPGGSHVQNQLLFTISMKNRKYVAYCPGIENI